MKLAAAWILGMLLHTAAQWLAIQPRPPLWPWLFSVKSASAKVIGLAVMELWNSDRLSTLFHGPSKLLPHTLVAAFILGYFTDSLAPRLLAVWPPTYKHRRAPRAKP